MQATLYLSPLLVSELNKLQADTHGQNGPDSVPASVTEWSQRLLDILTGERRLKKCARCRLLLRSANACRAAVLHGLFMVLLQDQLRSGACLQAT
jgi:hypothetical protein